MWQQGQTPVPGYKLVKFLGKGNFGEVWQSTSPGGTQCALKFLNLQESQGRKEFRAIQRLKQIRHANLMPINAIWLLNDRLQVIPDESLDALQPLMEDTHRRTLTAVPQVPDEERPKTLVIAMPLAEGNLLELLRQRQEQDKDIPVEELLVYMMDAARSLDFLNEARHDLGDGQVSVQHGDVKPENLVLLGGSVVLCDFGVARTFGGDSNIRGTTLGGTLAYMAPECMAGKSSPHSDQFSLAISYCELRAGQLPFPFESMTQVVQDRQSGQLQLDGLTPEEQRVIRKACSVNPDKRYHSNVAVVEALRSVLLGSKSKSGSKKWLVFSSVAALILATGFILWNMDFWTRPVEPVPTPVPPVADGNSYYAEALELLDAPSVSASQLAAATDLYTKALEAGFPAAIPEPIRLGVHNNKQREVYETTDLRSVTRLFAVHPKTNRVVLVGSDGNSLQTQGESAQESHLPLNLDSPIASVHWLAEQDVLVSDCQSTLWRVNLESKDKVKVLTGVLRAAACPTSELAVAASDGNNSGEGNVWRITSSETKSLFPSGSSPSVVYPLIAVDVAGEWAVVCEEFDDQGSATILGLRNDSEPVDVKTDVSPYCTLCVRVEQDCFAIVGGQTDQSVSGLALIQLGNIADLPSVTYPTFPEQESTILSNERRVRSLAVFVSPDSKRVVLASGQDGGSAGTELWKITSDDGLVHKGIVGQETKGQSISAIAFDDSGEWIARGTDYGEVLLTKLSHRNVDLHLMTEDYRAKVIQLQFVSGRLYCTFEDASIMVWDFNQCKMVYQACRNIDRVLPLPEFSRPMEG